MHLSALLTVVSVSAGRHSGRSPGAAKSIYQRLGGRPAVQAAADLLYQKLLADPRLSKFFEGMDMEALVKHQARRLACCFPFALLLMW